VVLQTFVIHVWGGKLATSCQHLSNIVGWKTERRGSVDNTLASYSEGPGFKSRPGDLLSWLSLSWLSTVRTGKRRDNALKLGHDHILSNHFQFVINL
jgi:hypothetical protein